MTLHGAKHIADAVAKKAKQNLVTAYNDAAGRTPVTTVATELGGTTLKSGVYDTSAGTLGLTGTLTLDGQGHANAVFIFEAASTLITAASSNVALINGAQACNVFWRIGSSATLDTATRFQGNILALTSIALKTGARLHGRALARNGAVTLDTNVITRDDCASATTTSRDTRRRTDTSADRYGRRRRVGGNIERAQVAPARHRCPLQRRVRDDGRNASRSHATSIPPLTSFSPRAPRPPQGAAFLCAEAA